MLLPCSVRQTACFCLHSCAARCLFYTAVQHLTFLRCVPQAAPGCGVSAPARRVPFRMHEKGPKVHIRGKPPYVSPGRVPAFGWVEGTRMSVPAPTCFLPRQALSLAPGRAAKPHYTVPDRTGAQGLPGRGTRGGVADPSPVRQPAGSSRRMPRFGASREDPRKAPCAYPFGLGPNGCCLCCFFNDFYTRNRPMLKDRLFWFL